jgi:hypothetical protein
MSAIDPSVDPSGSARQGTSGRRSRKGPDTSQQLTVGERAALLDHDPSLMSVALVLGTHVVREMIDDLAVTDEQEVIIARHHARDLVEEGPHVFTAMTFGGRVWFGRWSPGGAVVPQYGGDDAMAHPDLRAPAQNRGGVCGDPDARGVGSGNPLLLFSNEDQPTVLGSKSRPGATGGEGGATNWSHGPVSGTERACIQAVNSQTLFRTRT